MRPPRPNYTAAERDLRASLLEEVLAGAITSSQAATQFCEEFPHRSHDSVRTWMVTRRTIVHGSARARAPGSVGTPENIARMREMWEANRPARAIAAEIGAHHDTIVLLAAKHGFPPRGRGWRRPSLERARLERELANGAKKTVSELTRGASSAARAKHAATLVKTLYRKGVLLREPSDRPNRFRYYLAPVDNAVDKV